MSNSQKGNTLSQSKGFAPIFIILGIVLILGLVGGAYYFGKSSNATPQKNIPTAPTTTQSPTPTPTQKSTPTPTAKSDDISTWQTYNSISLGFSAKYPSSVKITPQQDGSIHMSIWGPTQKEQTEFYDGLSLSFSIGSLEGKTLDEYVNKNIETSLANDITLVKPLTDITVGDLKGKTYRISGLGEHTYLYFSPKSDKFFLITNSSNDPANQGYLKIADQIISSVRFN